LPHTPAGAGFRLRLVENSLFYFAILILRITHSFFPQRRATRRQQTTRLTLTLRRTTPQSWAGVLKCMKIESSFFYWKKKKNVRLHFTPHTRLSRMSFFSKGEHFFEDLVRTAAADGPLTSKQRVERTAVGQTHLTEPCGEIERGLWGGVPVALRKWWALIGRAKKCLSFTVPHFGLR